mmetsp:Transcript_9934/g.21849  ORF Transcript_9934/g.21849 Transcript_9934/m.21849 type:complete len:823 (+) Transcript_9934:166-2634(+)
MSTLGRECRRSGRLVSRATSRLGGGQLRSVHSSFLQKTLSDTGAPRHRWLKEVDQAPEKSSIRQQKDRYFRELAAVRSEMQSTLFDRSQKLAHTAVTKQTEDMKRKDQDVFQKKEDLNEAMRMYRLLRPDAPPFYEEDAVLGMKAKMNKVLVDQADPETQAALKAGGGANELFDPFKSYLPVVNQRAFLLALESIASSLADDVETLCRLLNPSVRLPAKDDPLRFKLLMDQLFDSFKLKKDPTKVKEFIDGPWQQLKLVCPPEIYELDDNVVKDWLQGHLRRVQINQLREDPKIFLHSNMKDFGTEEYYSFERDFPYDDDPFSGRLADERNLEFPLEKAGEYMSAFLQTVSQSGTADLLQKQLDGASIPSDNFSADVSKQFQDLVWDLEKVGLRNWLRMDVDELERFLPKGNLAKFALGEAPTGDPKDDKIFVSREDAEVAKLMLHCASRGRADLMDFEAVDPYKLLHGLPAREVHEELQTLPGSKHVSDEDLSGLVDAKMGQISRSSPSSAASEKEWLKQGVSVEDVYRRELDFYRTAGPVQWDGDADDRNFSWKWKQPPNTFWDPQTRAYVQEKKGVDPTLNLKGMRQHLLDVTRMNNMVKSGRANFFRAVVVVGNGKGVYGFGVGFGNTPKDSRADAGVKALQNLDYIDLDEGRMLPFPTYGQEYKHTAMIIPRALGRGVKANKRFLPLMYILGLDNCKIKFQHGRWFTRLRALRRALDGIMSRRTLANMTGKRYSHLVAPGDHWVHWPDRWFKETSAVYKARDRLLKGQRVRLAGKQPHNDSSQLGWRRQHFKRWSTPLEKLVVDRRTAAQRRMEPKA